VLGGHRAPANNLAGRIENDDRNVSSAVCARRQNQLFLIAGDLRFD
jgi:hypothetical protein